MSRRPRLVAFWAGGAALFALLVAGMRDLPPLGASHSVYGERLNEVAVAERHATDVVAAVNFDYRGFDTLGEEFILFTSVVGAATLLRQHGDEREEHPRDEDDRRRSRAAPGVSDAVRAMVVALVVFGVTFGGYMVTHGVPTPGGGFQGGVVLATAPLVVYLGSGPRTFHRIAPEALVEAAESAGAAGYVVIGAFGLALALPFLANVLPLGEPGAALSGGTIFALNLVVGIEVAAAFVLLLVAFVREALEVRLKKGRR
jgi:multicomponent Na+:H+ antiporter subunit B